MTRPNVVEAAIAAMERPLVDSCHRCVPCLLDDTREVIAARRQACYGALQITDAQIDELSRALVQMWQLREETP